jgi:WD40 repeat protein
MCQASACVGNPPVISTNGEAYFNQHFKGPQGPYGRSMRLKLADFDSPAVEIYRNEQVEVLALSQDDRMLAIGNVDSTIELVEIASGNARRLMGHERAVWTLDFSSDGRTLASGGPDGTVRLWRVDVGEPLGIIERWTNGDVQQVAFSPDGTRLAAAGRDGDSGSVRLWEVK